MTKQPRISIIIPIYNVEKYLQECLDSVFNQTFIDLEFICIDDGSTDSSPRLLDEAVKKEPRAVVIHQDNTGLSEARNVGMRRARGEYILFVDSDDTIAPDTCEKALEIADQTGADMTMFSLDLLGNPNGLIVPVGDIKQKSVYSDNLEKIQVVIENQFSACTALWKVSFLKKNALEFIPGIIYEDIPFTTSASILANRIATVGERLYHYRIRHDSISRGNNYGNLIGYSEVWHLTWERIRSLDHDGQCLNLIQQSLLNTSYCFYTIMDRSNRKILLNKIRQFLLRDTMEGVKTGRLCLTRRTKEFYLALAGNPYYRLKCSYRHFRLWLKKRLFKK